MRTIYEGPDGQGFGHTLKVMDSGVGLAWIVRYNSEGALTACLSLSEEVLDQISSSIKTHRGEADKFE